MNWQYAYTPFIWPMLAQIYVNHPIGGDHRFSAQTRREEEARKIRQEIEDLFDPDKAELRQLKEEKAKKRIVIAEAVNAYLADNAVQGLAEETVRYTRWFLLKRFLPWTEKEGLTYIDEVTTAQLTKWRSRWEAAPKTMSHWQAKLPALFRFCVSQGWCQTSPVSGLTKIKVPKKRVEFFSQTELLQILFAICALGLNGEGDRLRQAGDDSAAWLWAFVLLLRYSGLRLGDAARLERDRLQDDRLLLYQDKTGNPVFTVLPPFVVKSLLALPAGSSRNYFFWSGDGLNESAAAQWSRRLTRLF